MALGRSDTAPRALGCAGGRDERLPKTYSEGAVTRNARVLREVLFNYKVPSKVSSNTLPLSAFEARSLNPFYVYRISPQRS